MERSNTGSRLSDSSALQSSESLLYGQRSLSESPLSESSRSNPDLRIARSSAADYGRTGTYDSLESNTKSVRSRSGRSRSRSKVHTSRTGSQSSSGRTLNELGFTRGAGTDGLLIAHPDQPINPRLPDPIGPTVPDQPLAIPIVSLALLNDTGVSGSDGVTADATLTGQIIGSRVTQIQISVNGRPFTNLTTAFGSAGTFSLSAAQLATYNGAALSNGLQSVTVRAGNSAGSADAPLQFTFDNTPGSAIATAANVTTATTTATTYNFAVTYSDNLAIDFNSLGTGDVVVTGPNSFSQIATLIGVDTDGNGTPRTATYQITAPGTTWNTFDNGLYALTLAAGQVQDTAGNLLAAGGIGSFTVDIPFTTQRINFQPAAAAVPTGYTIDFGQAFDDARGYGWVSQGSTTPLDMTTRVFDRNALLEGAAVDQRLDTVALMQSGGAAASWEFALANGRYSVTASVGDTAGGSGQLIRVEGLPLAPAFTASGPQTFQLATRTVDVIDGRLTLDAIGGTDTRINFVEISAIAPGDHPSVDPAPLAFATDVNRRTGVNLSDLNLVGVGQGVDATTLTAATIQLYRTRDNAPVLSNYNTSGGADTIVVQPTAVLDANTQYTLRITDGVRDLGGRSFIPYSLTFTTGTDLTPLTGVNFDQSIVFTGAPLSSLVMSPDNQFLYATALDGQLRRWQVAADGSLSGLQTFSALAGSELVGITFDPNNPNVLWVAQNTATGSPESEDFSGKIVRITLTGGANFTATAQDYVVGLPRSGRDHFSNSLRFGPDGNLYLSQGSNTSAGMPDLAWSMRPERLLSAAILQINPNLTPPTGGFNVQTESYTTASGTVIPGNYNPFAADAPVRLYGTGLRNVYDFVFHSNGSLYAPTNGTGGGGNLPDNPNTPANESLSDVGSRPDFVFRVQQGGYYGHPNPSRGQYVMGGGNPTAGTDPDEVIGTPGVDGYPDGTLADPNYGASVFNLGFSRAPTGAIEYRSNTFNGRLQNRIILAEYSAGDDLIVLDLDASGNVVASSILAGGTANPGWGMANPLDLVENTSNGYIYVTELFPQGYGPDAVPGQIRLLRPA